MKYELVYFGSTKVAQVSAVRGNRVAVSTRMVRKNPSPRTWRELARKLSFDAPEAQ